VLTAEWRRQTDVYRLLRVSPTQPRSTLFKSHQARTDGLRRSAYKECKKNWVSHRSRSPDTINGLLCRARVLTRRAADGGNERRKAQKRQTLVLSSFHPLSLRRRQSPMYPLGKQHPASELVRYVYWESIYLYSMDSSCAMKHEIGLMAIALHIITMQECEPKSELLASEWKEVRPRSWVYVLHRPRL
jgi:hypothetical protein